MDQETARLWVTGDHLSHSRFEVAARLLIVPSVGSRRKALQPKRCSSRMANVAARVAGTLGEENGLNMSLEKIKIQGGCRRLGERHGRGNSQQRKSHRSARNPLLPDYIPGI